MAQPRIRECSVASPSISVPADPCGRQREACGTTGRGDGSPGRASFRTVRGT